MNKSNDTKIDEILPLVNENDEIIGKVSRSEAHKNPKIIHRIVAIIIYNLKDEILIQKRSLSKDILPGCWDLSAAGHLTYGEEYLTAAVHELREEIGIKTSTKELIPLGKFLIRSHWETEFCQVYKYIYKKSDHIYIGRDEVADAKFVSRNELTNLLADKNSTWNPKTRILFNKLSMLDHG